MQPILSPSRTPQVLASLRTVRTNVTVLLHLQERVGTK